jgi:hypothetical protein
MFRVHVPRFATDERFIGLNMAGEFSKRSLVKSEADAVPHVPSGLLGDSEAAANLV